jgi:hypothetical protein
MLADPPIFKPIPPDNVTFDRQAYMHVARRNGSLPLVFTPKEETSRAAILEYAAFVLEQEACYCQQ